MASQLREVLDDLASDVGSVEPAPELWSRGRRRHRRRVTSGVAAGAVLAALLVGGWPGLDLDRADPPVVDAPESELAIPDAFHDVPRFTRSTSDAGPPGPLAALWAGELGRGWWGSSNEVVGVSAVDGTYWFVDLPGRSADEGAFELSPDGRAIAYLLGGDVPGPGAQSDVVGFGVFDTVTGEVSRHVVDTRRGLTVEGPVWSADSQLVMLEYWQYTEDQGAADQQRTIAWDPASDRILENRAGDDWASRVGLSQDGLVVSTRQGIQVVDPVSGEVVRDQELDPVLGGFHVPNAWEVAFGPGDRVAWAGKAPVPGQPGSSWSGLYVGELTADGSPVPGRHLLPRRQSHGVIGWLDDEHVLVSALNRRPEGGVGFWNVDVTTGASEVAIECPEQFCQQQLAVDLLERPFRHFAAPEAFDPRPWVGVGVVGLLGCGWAFALWRRRRRAWS